MIIGNHHDYVNLFLEQWASMTATDGTGHLSSS